MTGHSELNRLDGLSALTRLGRLVRAATAALALLALVGGVPLLLAVTIGNPIAALPDLRAGDVSDTVVIDVLAAVAYAAWAQFTVAVAGEAFAQIRRAPSPRLPGVFAGQQQLAHTLVAAALLATPALSVAVAPPTPLTTHAAPATTTISSSTGGPVSARPTTLEAAVHAAPIRGAESAADPGKSAASLARVGRYVTIVIDADGPATWWDLAVAHLDDGRRWHDIWALNEGCHQADGAVMGTPGLLRPGWTIRIPAAETPPGAESGPDATRPGDQPGAEIAIPVKLASSTQAPRPDATDAASPQPLGDRTDTALPGTARTTTTGATVRASGAPSEGSDTVTLLGVGFGGGLLAGLALTALRDRRRRQLRYRRPGRAIAPTPHDLTSMERVIRGAGSASVADATWLDQALRSLSHRLAHRPRPDGDPHGRLPDVLAVCMTHETIDLVLAEPALSAPKPWIVDDGGCRWRVRRGDDLGYEDQQRTYQLSPYPALVSVGYGIDGDQWLLDLERLGLCYLTGDAQRCRDLLRFVAAELALSTWSDELDVDLVGLGEELVQLNPDRLHHSHDPQAAVATYLARRAAVREALDRSGSDVLTGRLHNVDTADMLMPHVLLLDAADGATRPALERLTAAADRRDSLDGPRDGKLRAAVAALVSCAETNHTTSTTDIESSATRDGCHLTIDRDGVLRIPALGLELIAQRVPTQQAGTLARLLAASASTADQPMPLAPGDQPWEAHTDAAGAPLPGITVARSHLSDEQHDLRRPSELRRASVPGETIRDRSARPTGDWGTPGNHLRAASPPVSFVTKVSSVLPAAANTYVRASATTHEDVAALAPGIPDEAHRQVRDADPTLDADLADWHDPACPLPRLTLLGPVNVRAHGPLPEVRPRRAWHTEIVAYLATHPRGVSAEQFGGDLWPDDPDIASKTKVRQSIHLARRWLGPNPRTGRDHLPAATPSPAGPALYTVEDVLVDAELFRRLRARGITRGPDGIADLQAALDLVTGPPFDRTRPGGYGWLASNALDHAYTGMIVDVAHLVATHHLAAGRPDHARAAAQAALTAGSTDDIPLLDLVAVCDAEGHRGEAAHYVERILANHDAEVEEDLPPRTAEILHRRQSIGQAS